MTDIQSLERDIIASIGAASDEAALEGVRISALGKKGAISELLNRNGKVTTELVRLSPPVSVPASTIV